MLAFFSSGAAALIFETVWLYRCGLLLGQTVWAVTTVLSAFMAGLGLGNLLVALYGALLFGGAGAGARGMTLDALSGRDAGLLAAHFHWVFAAAAMSLALSFVMLVLMEERPLRSGAVAAAPAE